MKCTGIHAGALCSENSVSYIHWNRCQSDWEAVIERLDPEIDVLLFPYPHSIPAETFSWSMNSSNGTRSNSEERGEMKMMGSDTNQPCINRNNTSAADTVNEEISQTSNSANFPMGMDHINNTNKIKAKKKRLIVLEASWNYAKTMAQQIIEYREKLHLPAIPSIILHDVTGQYWRFHAEGHAAVSTIEAIAHTAKAANINEYEVDKLLTLFRVQKYRVLKNCQTKKVPRAIEVSGVGIGSWKEVVAINIS
jgi:hypothetical protein